MNYKYGNVNKIVSFYFHTMKPLHFISFLLILFIIAGCKTYPKAENAFDAGREFIDGCLKGDFDRAGFYLLRNDANDKRFDKIKSDYRNKTSDQKAQYYDASINILEEDAISDSVHIISYKNSFDDIARKVKVLQTKDGWLVDLSYTFSGNL